MNTFSYINQLVLIIYSVDKQWQLNNVNKEKRGSIFSPYFKASHPAPFFVDFIFFGAESFKEVMMINNKNKQTSLRIMNQQSVR